MTTKLFYSTILAGAILCGNPASGMECDSTGDSLDYKVKSKNYTTMFLNNRGNDPVQNRDALVEIVNIYKGSKRIMIDTQGKNFEGINFSTIFKNKKLQIVFDFKNCNLQRVDFTDCHLCGAIFDNANLESAIFDGADLSNADDKARLHWGFYKGENWEKPYPVYSDTSFENANIKNVSFKNTRIEPDILEKALNTETTNLSSIKEPSRVGGYQK